MKTVRIYQLDEYEGQEVSLRGWLMNRRGSNKFQFLLLRDGSGQVQMVADRAGLGDSLFETIKGLNQESAIRVTGLVSRHEKDNSFEIHLTGLELISDSVDYPITPKEHGIDFLLNHRHLWLRSRRTLAILRIRHEAIRAIRNFFDDRHFTLVDSPILTRSIGESNENLFKVDYFHEGTASLAQTGQLYIEAAIFAFGDVYCFGPTFRAEKSKTRKHLTEFWMFEAEMAFCEHADSLQIQEEMIVHVVQTVLKNRRSELETLQRDLAALEKITGGFKRLDYDDAISLLQAGGSQIKWGDDLGAEDETRIAENESQPVFITGYPAECKAFYMKKMPGAETKVLCADLIAPEGYGEIIGGSEREENMDSLLDRLKEKDLPAESYGWYLDLRRYGSVPHSGFGLGLERLIAYICGLDHVREAIPFPRLMGRLEP